MKHISVTEAADRWGLSGRIVRRYCSEGRIDGAFVTGRTWNIPEDASPPERKRAGRKNDNALLIALKEEKNGKIKGRIYPDFDSLSCGMQCWPSFAGRAI